MTDKYKSSLANALDHYFDLLNGAKKRDAKQKAIVKNKRCLYCDTDSIHLSAKKKRGEKK